MRRADVVIVGGGVMGAATAWQLSRSGRKVVLLERFAPGHRRGSSHGPSRVFRLSYDNPLYVGMALRALPLWRVLEEQSGREVLSRVGGLDFGRDLEGHVSALSQHGVPHQVLEPRDAARRFPSVRVPGEGPVLYQADAGIVRADQALRALLDVAAEGTEVRQGVPALRLELDGAAVTVRTPDGDLRAPAAVVTAGAWAGAFLATAGIELPVAPTRETVAYFPMDRAMEAPILVDWEGPPLYGLPAPRVGIKAGAHRTGPRTDPDRDGEVDPEIVARLSRWVERRYPGADPTPRLAETCLYTNTDDERFILERHGRVVVGAACSGHAFKFAPLIGARLAEMALAALG